MDRGAFPGSHSWKPPLFRLGRFPIYVTGLIVLLQVVGMLIVVVTGGAIAAWTYFTVNGVLSGKVWTIVTYAFFEGPSIWFVLGAYFFFNFGSMVEHSMSRRDYVVLCLVLLFIPPVVFLTAHFLNLPSVPAMPLPLSNVPHLSVFMACCAMFPNIPTILLGIRLKWLGLAFFAIALLQWISYRIWPMVIAYLVAVGFSVWYVRRLGFREGFSLGEELLGPGKQLPRIGGGGKKKKPRRAKEIKSKLRPKSELLKKDDTEVDRILDKINREGLHSLTDEERDLLQRRAGK